MDYFGYMLVTPLDTDYSEVNFEQMLSIMSSILRSLVINTISNCHIMIARSYGSHCAEQRI